MVGYRQGYAGATVFFLREELLQWLRTHAGPGCHRHNDSEDSRCFPSHSRLFWRWDFICLDITEIIFEFKNPQHAMLFRLTWGGNLRA
jgi:hypothetical protein